MAANVILALIADLYQQILNLQQREEKLISEITELQQNQSSKSKDEAEL